MNIVDKAEVFATGVHIGQVCGVIPGKKPGTYDKWTSHLQRTVNVLNRWAKFGDDKNLVAAAWLHDSITYASVEYSDLRDNFNGDVAELVLAVTSKDGDTKLERQVNTLLDIRTRVGDRGVALKLAEKIAQVENSAAIDREAFNMHRQEYPLFKVLLGEGNARNRCEIEMWETLENLLTTSPGRRQG